MINKERQTLMFARVDEWEKSGRTMRDFASGIGLSKSCLEYWIRKKRISTGNSPQFVELVPLVSPKAEMLQSIKTNEHITPAQIVFTFPGGLCVKVYGQMLGLSANLRYYQCCQPTDMRNGFDGLAGIVRNHLGKDPVCGDIFIFLNKPRTHIKLLYWDGDGFALFYKRLEKGRYQQCTAVNNPSKEIKREELMMLLEGLSYDKMRRTKRFGFV